MGKLIIKKNELELEKSKSKDDLPLPLPRMSWLEKLIIAGGGEIRQRLLINRSQSIREWHDDASKLADYVLKKNIEQMMHIPDDYDERDKYLRTVPYIIKETLYAGRCKDIVKLKNGEWNVCPLKSEVCIPIHHLEDEDSLRQVIDVLLKVSDGIQKITSDSLHT